MQTLRSEALVPIEPPTCCVASYLGVGPQSGRASIWGGAVIAFPAVRRQFSEELVQAVLLNYAASQAFLSISDWHDYAMDSRTSTWARLVIHEHFFRIRSALSWAALTAIYIKPLPRSGRRSFFWNEWYCDCKGERGGGQLLWPTCRWVLSREKLLRCVEVCTSSKSLLPRSA